MTFWRTYYHIVWSTKNREPLVQPEIEPRLFGYIINKAAELGVFIYAINGYHNHIHILVSIPPKLSVADIVKELKGSSSHDLNSHGISFAWQRGYGVLTFGESQRSYAEDYVRNQKQHHEEQTTNFWLERNTEEDEGPENLGLKPERVPTIQAGKSIKEPEADYRVSELSEVIPF